MRKLLFAFLAGMLIGASAMRFGVVAQLNTADATAPNEVARENQSSLKYPLEVTLYRFELNGDKLDRFEDWMQFYRDNMLATVATLERERMYFEAMFRDRTKQKDVVYWLAVNGKGGKSGDNSPLEIDKKHREYMKEILKKGSRTALSTEFVLVPRFVEAAVQQHEEEGERHD